MSRALWWVTNGRAAAPPAIACSVGPSTSTNPSPASVLRIDCDDLRPPQEPLPHALGVDQVEVAHPLPQLGIGQALVLGRRRLDRLGEEVQVGGEDRQLARLGVGSARRRRRRCRPGRSTGPSPSSARPPGSCPTRTWILPVQSRMSRKISLPARRWSTIRPAARTWGPCCWGGLPDAASAAGSTTISVCRGADLADGLAVVEALAPGVDAHLSDLAKLLPPRGLQSRPAHRLVTRLIGHRRRSVVSCQLSAISGQQSAVSNYKSASKGRRSAIGTSHSPLAPRPSPLAPHPSPLAPRPSPLVPRPSPLATHPSPLAPHPSPLATRHSPLTTRHSPLTTRHSPPPHRRTPRRYCSKATA